MLIFSPDGKFLVTGDAFGDIKTGQQSLAGLAFCVKDQAAPSATEAASKP